MAASEQPTWQGTKLMLDLGSAVNATNESGDTALHGAAGHAYSTVVELLVGHGAKLDIKNKRGTTAQDLLCRSSASDRC